MYTKKCIPQCWRIGALTLGVTYVFGGMSFSDAAPAPQGFAVYSRSEVEGTDGNEPSTGAYRRSYQSYRSSAPVAPTIPSDPPYDTVGAAPSTSAYIYPSNADRPGNAQEAAMLVACGLERRPYGSAFDGNRVSSQWKWSDVRRDSSRELEFSQLRHGAVPFQNPMCELFVLRRMYEQGGASSVQYRCQLRRNEYASAMRNIQAGRGTASSGFGLLDKVMASRSSQNNQTICRSPGSEDLFACATQDYTNQALNGPLQSEMASGIMDICNSYNANMTPSQSYYNAGIVPGGGGFCGQSGGVTVLMENEPWYKTVLSAAVGALKVAGPLYVINKANQRREQTSQMAIAENSKLGFPSGVTGAGIGGMGMMYGGYGAGFGGGTMCGMPPYLGCAGGGFNALGYGNMIGSQFGVAGYNGLQGYYPQMSLNAGLYNGGGIGGIGGVGGLNGFGTLNGGVGGLPYGGGGFGAGGPIGAVPMLNGGGPMIGNGFGGLPYGGGGFGGAPFMGGGAGGLPGPFGTLSNGASGGWAPSGSMMGANPWGPQGQFGQAPYWGTNMGNGYAGANNGYFQDSAYAQQARAIENNNRYAQLYGNLVTDSQSNSNNLRNTASSYYSGSYSTGAGFQYYPAYNPQPYIPQPLPQQIK